MKKKILLSFGITIGILVVILWTASSFMLQFSLSPANRGKDLDGSWAYMFENYPEADDLDDEFIEMEEEVTEIVARYIDENIPNFAEIEK